MKRRVLMNMYCNPVALALAAYLVSCSAWAGEVSNRGDGAVTWQAGVDGVEIEWEPDGTVKRISSRYSTPVEFGDRRGIYKGQVIAEEKAKAAIIRFMKQDVATTRVVTEVQNDLNKASQERSSGTATHTSKVDTRTLIENLTEITASFAAGSLRGVIILEKGYDNKTEEAWAVVGISDQTIRAAQGTKAMTTEPSGGRGTATQGPTGAGSITTQPSEVRRSNQRNW
jgi:hypothetical protein